VNKEQWEQNPNKCKICNSVIPFDPRKRRRDRKYCNLLCFGEYLKEKNIRNYNSNPLKCVECEKIIPYYKRRKRGETLFCNNTCSSKYRIKHRKLSLESRRKISEFHKKFQRELWTPEKRKEHALKMKKVVDENPDSYSRHNVCGRVKSTKILDSLGNETKCNGKWELLVAEYLTKNNIRWTNKIEDEFRYEWNKSIHRYFPDFKLLDIPNTYIEVKGYQRERDLAKWNQFPYKLIIIKKHEILEIKNNIYCIDKELKKL
jgi:hypothetical protein